MPTFLKWIIGIFAVIGVVALLRRRSHHEEEASEGLWSFDTPKAA